MNNSWPPARTQIDSICDTVSQLKTVIKNREKSYSLSQESERAYKAQIKCLEYQNRILQEVIKSKNLEGSTIDLSQNNLDTNIESNGCVLLKKIIFKQERRLREMAKYSRCSKFSTSHLNDNERELVELIVSKHIKKLRKKSLTNIRSMSCDRDMGSQVLRIPRAHTRSADNKRFGHGDVAHCQNQGMDVEAYLKFLKNTDDKKDVDLIDFTD